MNDLTQDQWYLELQQIAGKVQGKHLVRDREAWTSNWQNETPREAFIKEYPEYESDV